MYRRVKAADDEELGTLQKRILDLMLHLLLDAHYTNTAPIQDYLLGCGYYPPDAILDRRLQGEESWTT